MGSALALFILPILQARYGTNMFWIVSLAALIPIIFLLIIRFERSKRMINRKIIGIRAASETIQNILVP